MNTETRAKAGHDTEIQTGAKGPSAFTLRYEDQRIDLSLEVDTRVRKATTFPIYLAPYDLDLKFEDARLQTSGTMVFEIGRWDSF